MPSPLSYVSSTNPKAIVAQETINQLQSQITGIEAILAKLKKQN